MDVRRTLISSGEDLAARRWLGADFTDAEYIVAVEVARELGAGKAYADKVLGIDVEDVLGGTEDEGEATVKAAERRLRSRGIDPQRASYAQYREALLAVEVPS